MGKICEARLDAGVEVVGAGPLVGAAEVPEATRGEAGTELRSGAMVTGYR